MSETIADRVLGLCKRILDPERGYRAAAGGDLKTWHKVFGDLAHERALAARQAHHELVVLIDTVVIHANQHDPAVRELWGATLHAMLQAIGETRQ